MSNKISCEEAFSGTTRPATPASRDSNASPSASALKYTVEEVKLSGCGYFSRMKNLSNNKKKRGDYIREAIWGNNKVTPMLV